MSKYVSRKNMSEKDRRESEAIEEYLKTCCDTAFKKIMASNPQIAAKAKKIKESR